MKKFLMAALFAVVAVHAVQPWHTADPQNARSYYVDTVFVTGTDTAYSEIFWQGTNYQQSFVIEADDTSAAGVGGDSAAVAIEVLQAFEDGSRDVLLLHSRAHPDSLSFPYGSRFLLGNLDATTMDTAAVYKRVRVPRIGVRGDTTGYIYSTEIDTLGSDVKALDYYTFPVHYSPGLVFRLIGAAGNKAGSASRWIIRAYEQPGSPVFND